MTSIEDRFQHLQDKIKNRSFQQNRGLSNEVGYYIFDYDPTKAQYVRDEIRQIAAKSTVATVGVDVKIFNIFDIMMKIVDDFGYRDAFSQLEKDGGILQVIEQMNNILEMNSEENLIVKAIQSQINSDKLVIFITGIGEVFPLLRAHKILNTMNQVIDRIPVILFYPGSYNSLSLQAFNQLQDDNYYRAFRLN
jgi:glutaredoxin-related protein